MAERWAWWRFERQARELLAPLYRVALRLTGKHEDAEDLVQDAIVKAYRAFGRTSFDGPAGFRAWLFTILVNCFRDGYRRRSRSAEVALSALENELESNVIELVPDLAPGPDLQLEGKQLRDAAQAVIDRMAPEIRLAVMLFFIEGCTYQEIADIAVCPVGTVMSRLWRGRRILQKELGRRTHDVSRKVEAQ